MKRLALAVLLSGCLALPMIAQAPFNGCPDGQYPITNYFGFTICAPDSPLPPFGPIGTDPCGPNSFTGLPCFTTLPVYCVPTYYYNLVCQDGGDGGYGCVLDVTFAPCN